MSQVVLPGGGRLTRDFATFVAAMGTWLWLLIPALLPGGPSPAVSCQEVATDNIAGM